MGEIVWRPSQERVAGSNLESFRRRTPVEDQNYAALWQWSLEDPDAFWAAVWDDSEVVASQRFDTVLTNPAAMPGAQWFQGARLNYAENLLRFEGSSPAVIGAGEGMDDRVVSRDELRGLVARAQEGLRQLGVGPRDRVAAFVPNCLEAVVVMLAATALGAVWSSCSPDFGAKGVVDRFAQIRPTVLLTADGYRYAGKTHSLQSKVDDVCEALPGLGHVVVIDFSGQDLTVSGVDSSSYAQLLDNEATETTFEQVAPDHPLFIMYSSGTTGVPKSIVHGHGGTLLTHLKEQRLHVDLKPGDVVFWFTTCGWMMWNWLVSALATGAAIVLYDGSPTHPGVQTLWNLAERQRISHFGTSPKFLAACAKAGLRPKEVVELRAMQAVLSTGSPLNPDQFDWVYDAVAADVHLASMSGGTDLLGCFAGGVPTLPVRRGELQARTLGMAVEAWDDAGRPVIGERGELVCTQPFPSMPVGFWNDDTGQRYRAAYFSQYPGVWTHGDFIEIRPEGGVIIHGRSDTTLNPGGVRIGTAEIYRAIETLPEVLDSIVVGRPVDGDVDVVLCLKLREGYTLDDELVTRIKRTIRETTTPRHVPAHVFAVADIPYTISGKKVEKAVRDTMTGQAVHNRDALANPESLDEYRDLPFPV